MKSALIPATTPTVFGLDVTSSGISISKLVLDEKPLCKRIPAPDSRRKSHSVASGLHRQRSTTRLVLDTVLRDGIRPHLVVMGKLSWGLQAKDPSAGRRAAQWWDIASALCDAHVPVAEVPLGTISSWAMDKSPGLKADGLAALRKDIADKWDGLDADFTAAGELFRPSAAGYACFGAMLVGMPTPYAPTEERIRKLTQHHGWTTTATGTKTRGWVHSQSVQFPAAVRPVPTTVSEWNARAAALGAAVAEPDVTVTIDDDGDAEVA
ncbi:hypothetical protein [Mycolicibacter arupensis]|uniref:Uncharacterized protein n=1 Tax=Mycolicibacter arupensis TaxID=342002 RepID=A0A5C7Y2L2_9MYCO|nr:hypothetical protein [Mycolicibacter arupensis]TXI55913.1 MAG: hypothetical protein E6Q54_11845 [Mycolicibacter arupensis]